MATVATKNDRDDQIVKSLTSILSKPVPYFKHCSVCGETFAVNSKDSELDKCLPCQVKEDMRLSDDTIINYNVLSLWKANRYDKTKGIDPLLLAVAEGIFVMPDDVVDRPKQTIVTTIKRKFGNDEIESKLRQLIKASDEKCDAVLIFRFGVRDDFSVFKIVLGSRIYDKLKGRSLLFIKKYMISIVVKHIVKKAKGKKKTSKK